MYASRLLNRTKHNYSTTERKALVMVFALHKFRHYLLGNKFVFYVDHITLVYLVNKPWVSRRIIKWLLLFLEYDFTIMYKLSKVHAVANALSRLLDIIEPISVLDQTIDASLFYTKLEWLKNVKEFLRIRQIEGMLLIQTKQRLIRKAKPFTLKSGELYRTGQNNR
jgi:hypothetical protein